MDDSINYLDYVFFVLFLFEPGHIISWIQGFRLGRVDVTQGLLGIDYYRLYRL